MTYFELTSTEKDYYDKLKEDEKRIYLANKQQLEAIDTWNEPEVKSFVEVSKLLNELCRLHTRYNDITDFIYKKPNATEKQQKYYDNIYNANIELFSVSLSIGNASAVLQLYPMDECDALYTYLSKLKMCRFDIMCDNFDIAVLIETLQSHEVY